MKLQGDEVFVFSSVFPSRDEAEREQLEKMIRKHFLGTFAVCFISAFSLCPRAFFGIAVSLYVRRDITVLC